MSSRKAPVLLSHFLSVEKLTTQQVFSLLQRAHDFKSSPTRPKFTREINVANLFFENSTRTKLSFTMAEQKLGLN
ncbi:hypothetical protein ACQW56_32755, partial [Bacillus cereus]